jgi:hypothetical protein
MSDDDTTDPDDDYYADNRGYFEGIDPYYHGFLEDKPLEEDRIYYGDLVKKLLADLFLNGKDYRKQLKEDDLEPLFTQKLDYVPPGSKPRRGQPPRMQIEKKLRQAEHDANFFVEEALTNFIYQCVKEVLHKENLVREDGTGALFIIRDSGDDDPT